MSDRREYEFEGTSPTIDDDAHVSRESTLVGDVRIEADASVWPGAVLRGDIAPVRIGRESHIGDNATIHAGVVGDQVMIAHGAVLNEVAIEDNSLVGFNATINTGVTIGEGSIVAAGTVLPEEYAVPADSFVRGIPARVTPLEETEINVEAVFTAYSSGDYTDLATRHDELFE
ncbi:DapH/DapD/GlmU-related protein [Halomontanus rarus]|uniref:DapH/DapD/GlmU-related protein n=1 Tax=Halomontanus rarus TaxID=3034020 RepID=UPI001A996A1D